MLVRWDGVRQWWEESIASTTMLSSISEHLQRQMTRISLAGEAMLEVTDRSGLIRHASETGRSKAMVGRVDCINYDAVINIGTEANDKKVCRRGGHVRGKL